MEAEVGAIHFGSVDYMRWRFYLRCRHVCDGEGDRGGIRKWGDCEAVCLLAKGSLSNLTNPSFSHHLIADYDPPRGDVIVRALVSEMAYSTILIPANH